jgi:hypothetical protein
MVPAFRIFRLLANNRQVQSLCPRLKGLFPFPGTSLALSFRVSLGRIFRTRSCHSPPQLE